MANMSRIPGMMQTQPVQAAPQVIGETVAPTTSNPSPPQTPVLDQSQQVTNAGQGGAGATAGATMPGRVRPPTSPVGTDWQARPIGQPMPQKLPNPTGRPPANGMMTGGMMLNRAKTG